MQEAVLRAPTGGAVEDVGPAPLAPLPRLGLSATAWILLYLANPGVLVGDGSASLAVVALALWGSSVTRPGRFAGWIEWLTAAVGVGAQLWWVAYVSPPGMVLAGIVLGGWMTVGARVARVLARRHLLVLAVGGGWLVGESLRFLLPMPLSMEWMRLGHHLAATPWLGSARVWGVGGLTLIAASLGGFLASFRGAGAGRRPELAEWVLGLGPAALGLLFAVATAPPETEPGPEVLLVQPNVPQARKRKPMGPGDLFRFSARQTERSLADAAAAGRPEPDLVVWGESMLGAVLAGHGLEAAYERGARSDPWVPTDPELFSVLRENERYAVLETLLGVGMEGGGLLPPGTSFLSGAEFLRPVEGRLRRQSGGALWKPSGEREPAVGKVYMVPGAESMMGFERFAWVRDLMQRVVAGYVPDLLGFEETGVLRLSTREGRLYRMATTICFDNAHEEPTLGPVDREPVDFHVVLSNEAWYLESCELDQMVAFSRVACASSGRAMVRSTNSGVTVALGPRGEELARLVVGGKDRLVAGGLSVRVPVPVPGEGHAKTPYVRFRRFWRPLWLGIPLALCFLGRSRRPSGPPRSL